MKKTESKGFMETTVAYPLVEKAYALVAPSSVPFSSAVVGITLPSPSYMITRGRGEMSVFEYVAEGEGMIYLDGEWKKASAGDFYILAEGEDHKYRASRERPWKKLWVNYRASYTASMLSSYGVKSGIYRSPEARGLFEELISLTRSHDGSELISFEIADRINAIIRLAAITSCELRAEENDLKRRLGGFVHKKLDLDILSSEVHMSKSNLIRCFKKQYGITPYEYLLGLKIETAKALLCNTELSQGRIAEKLAISDEHYFSTLFKKRTGMRPSEYRRLCKE